MAGFMESGGLMDAAKASKGKGMRGFMDTLVNRQIDSGQAPVSRAQMDQLSNVDKSKGLMSNLAEHGGMLGGMLRSTKK